MQAGVQQEPVIHGDLAIGRHKRGDSDLLTELGVFWSAWYFDCFEADQQTDGVDVVPEFEHSYWTVERWDSFQYDQNFGNAVTGLVDWDNHQFARVLPKIV